MTAPSDKATGPLLLDLATVTVLITALVYFTGWTYAYHYFSHFKLGLLTLKIPTEYFLCMAFGFSKGGGG
jgi:F0F1-type ATP synthase assembly protein I